MPLLYISIGGSHANFTGGSSQETIAMYFSIHVCYHIGIERNCGFDLLLLLFLKTSQNFLFLT